MANEFVYAQPVKIFFGEGKFAQLGSVLDELGVSRCVIACGKHFAPTAQAMMEKDPRIVAVFGGVEQNPQLSGVIETTRLAREHKADAVIGIGGGSSIDTAKFAAAIALDGHEAIEYYRGERPFPTERLTIIAVPTTAGTGSPQYREEDHQHPCLHAEGRDRRSRAHAHRAAAHHHEHRP